MKQSSKSESAYEDDFDSVSKSHLSASRARQSHVSQSYSTNFDASASLPPAEKVKSATITGAAGAKNIFNQNRKSLENNSEKYSPIKEAKDENSLEEDRKYGEDSSEGSGYTSVQGSESTMRNKYSNLHGGMGVSASGSKIKGTGAGIEDSMAESSYMMSSAGKDNTLKSKMMGGGGKTTINVGNVNLGASKDSAKQLGASSNLDETEEEDSESMSISQSGGNANKLA